MTNKEDAYKIKKLLGLNGDEMQKNNYYNVTDVLIALMHFCDQAGSMEEDVAEVNWDFETHLESAREGYIENIKEVEYNRGQDIYKGIYE